MTVFPPVTAVAALEDRSWFVDRGWWLVRRRPQGASASVLLRTWSPARARGDHDGAIASLWYQAAFPNWPAEQLRKAARKELEKHHP